MSCLIRKASIEDVWALQPVMRPADLSRYGVQILGSEAFALVDDAGDVFAAGGIYVDNYEAERICWMLVRPSPPARDLVEAVRLICDHAGPGWPLVAYVDERDRRHVRFAEVLGFVSSACVRAPSLPAHVIRMERRA